MTALYRLDLKVCEVVAGMHNIQTADSRDSLGGALLDCVRLHAMRDAERQVKDSGVGGAVRVGDRVMLVKQPPQVHRALASHHGGWTNLQTDAEIKKCCGNTGRVTKIDDDGDIRVDWDKTVAKIDSSIHSPYALINLDRSGDSAASPLPEGKWDPWAIWRATIISGDQQLPKLSTVIVGEWTGTEEQAKVAVEEEAEALLLSALDDLEVNAERASSAQGAAELLVGFYRGQGRTKEYKAMEKRLTLLDNWVSDESSSEEETDSDSDPGSDSDASDDNSSPSGAERGDVLRMVLSRAPGLAAAMEDDSDEHVVSAHAIRLWLISRCFVTDCL